MHITGAIKDYYDSAMSLGIDKELIFVRNSSIHHFDGDNADLYNIYKNYLCVPTTSTWRKGGRYKPNFKLDRHWMIGGKSCNSYDNIDFDPFVIFFCGKVYRGVKVFFTYSHKKQHEFKAPHHVYVYTKQHAEALLTTHTEEIEDYNYNKRNTFEQETISKIANYVSINGEFNDEVAEYMYNHKIAYFLMSSNEKEYSSYLTGTVEFHPLLKNLQFVKIVDPYTAFQEISMFVGNTPRDPNMMVVLTDKEELIKKGFDNMSFKKEPTKKNKRGK